jgi:hypothetical protein
MCSGFCHRILLISSLTIVPKRPILSFLVYLFVSSLLVDTLGMLRDVNIDICCWGGGGATPFPDDSIDTSPSCNCRLACDQLVPPQHPHPLPAISIYYTYGSLTCRGPSSCTSNEYTMWKNKKDQTLCTKISKD